MPVSEPTAEPESQPGPEIRPESPSEIPPETPPPAKSGSVAALVLALLALGLSIGLAAAAWFSWHQLQRVSNDLDGIETRLDQRLQPLRSSLSDIDRLVQDQRRQLDTRLESLAGEQARVAQRVSVLASLVGRSEQGWTLAEVEYLLRIASQRLQLQRDTGTARVALEAADARLRDLADPHFLVVREQIAKELDALARVPAVDRDGISATLTALMARIDALPVAGSDYQPVAAQETAESEKETGAPTVQDWRELPALLWSVVSDLFRIREHEQQIKPMLPPEREYFLRENLRLQLSAARLALLRDDSAQYRLSLETAAGWLEDYFASDDQVHGMQAQLEKLAAVAITPDLPDVSAALRLLRRQLKIETPAAPSDTQPGSEAEPPQDNEKQDSNP